MEGTNLKKKNRQRTVLLVADKYGLDIKSTLSILPLGGHKPSLISARRTTTKWCALISNEILAAKLQSSAADAGYSLNDDEMATAAKLISSGHLAREAMSTMMSTLAAMIKTSWSRGVHAAAGPGAAQHRGHAQPGQGGLGQGGAQECDRRWAGGRVCYSIA